MSGYSSAVKLEIEKFDGRIFWLVANTSQGCVDTIRFAQGVEGEVSSWYCRTAIDKDELWQSGPQLHMDIG